MLFDRLKRPRLRRARQSLRVSCGSDHISHGKQYGMSLLAGSSGYILQPSPGVRSLCIPRSSPLPYPTSQPFPHSPLFPTGIAFQVTTLTDTSNQLPDHNHLETPRHLLLQRAILQQALARKARRADIGIQTELFPNPQQTLLGTDGSDAPLGSAYSACRCQLQLQRLSASRRGAAPDIPSKIASASLQDFRVSSGRGSPVASIPAPPNGLEVISSWSEVCLTMVSRTRTASAVTSGPACQLLVKIPPREKVAESEQVSGADIEEEK